MKTRLLAGIMWLMMAVVAAAQTTNLTALLQQGLMEEQANQNLDAAIASYQQLAAQFDKDRQVAATAIFRIGECYRTLGRTNEAAAQYQRILHDFSDQKSLATLSEQNLRGMGMGGTEPTQVFQQRLANIIARAPAQSPEMQVQVIEHQRQLAELEAQLNAIENASVEQQRVIMQQNYSNPVLTSLLERLENLQKVLAQFKNWPNPNNSEATSNSVVKETAKVMGNMEDINSQINDQVKAVVTSLQQKIAAEKAILGVLEQQQSSASPPISGTGTPRDSEDQEIQRIQQVIQNSPDLINQPGPDGNTELIKAAGAGEIKVVTYLLDHGADVNQHTGKSFPLLEAVAAGNRSMVELLLSRGADVNARSGDGDALHMAALKRFQSVMEVLVAHKADVNSRDATGRTPLALATTAGQDKIVRMLLAAGADPNLADNGGRTPLTRAIRGDAPDIVAILLASGVAVNTTDQNKRSPLSHAAEFDNVDVIKLLLDAKADPNGSEVDPPLLLATQYADTNSMELLLQAGANPNAAGALGGLDANRPELRVVNPAHRDHMTPLWLAIDRGSLPAVQLLLRFKADPNDIQTTRQSLLFDAVYRSGILKAMLDAGAKMEVTSRNEQQWTPLGAAVNVNNVRAVEILLQHGANPNFHNRNGVTPLHLTAYGLVDDKIVELLLAGGANPNVRTGNGRTPLDELNRRRDDTQSTSEQRAKAIILADLLRRHGALDKLPDWDRITVSRPEANFSAPVFFKATNDWNHFTLLEMIYEFYNNGRLYPIPATRDTIFYGSGNSYQAYQALPFPDLAHVVIVRPNGDSTNETRITVNLLNTTNDIDCTKDIPLQFGDVVLIPERDHSLVVQSAGLTESQSKTIAARFAGKVQLIAGGQKTDITLYEPQWSSMLNNVLQHEEAQRVLLSSSDLAHVKVTRHDAQTGKKHEWIVDCSSARTSSNGTQTLSISGYGSGEIAWYKNGDLNGTDNSALSSQGLILRAGDVIEVPEKH